MGLAYWTWDHRAAISGTLDIAVVFDKYFVMYKKFHLFFYYFFIIFMFRILVVALYRALQPLSIM